MANIDRLMADVELLPLSGDVLRLVESQEKVATARIVSSLERQALLEDILERSKPPLSAVGTALHWLLATPFRYPPLRYGSRFGAPFEPSLFYGSWTHDTVFAEGAYYGLVLWYGMKVPPAHKTITEHTVFGARYSGAGVALQKPPFSAYRDDWRNPVNYGTTQHLGAKLREIGARVIEYESARDPAGGINVALLKPEALASHTPGWQLPCLCETSSASVTFQCEGRIYHFDRELFMVDGALPNPAN